MSGYHSIVTISELLMVLSVELIWNYKRLGWRFLYSFQCIMISTYNQAFQCFLVRLARLGNRS